MKIIANDSLLGCPHCTKVRIFEMSVDSVSANIAHGDSSSGSGMSTGTGTAAARSQNASSGLTRYMTLGDLTAVVGSTTGATAFCMFEARLREYIRLLRRNRKEALDLPEPEHEVLESVGNAVIDRLIKKRQKITNYTVPIEDVADILKLPSTDPKALRVWMSLVGREVPMLSDEQEDRIAELFRAALPILIANIRGNIPHVMYAWFCKTACILLGWDRERELFANPPESTFLRLNVALREVCKELDWKF